MAQVFDQTQDLSGKEQHRLTTLFAPPDFVKAASYEQLQGDPESLPRHAYADQLHRRYPTHTAPATWLSTLFFLDKQAQYTQADAATIDARLRQAAVHFGIAGAVEVTRQKFASSAHSELDALPDEDFALVWVSDTGKDRKFPLRNGAEVKVAAAYFDRHLDEFEFADRNLIANRLLHKASQHGVGLGDTAERFEKSAGWGVSSPTIICSELGLRATMLRPKHPEIAEQLNKLATALVENPDQLRNKQMMFKLAANVDAVDRECSLTVHYASGKLSTPEDLVYGITQKIARAFASEHVTTLTGNVYALSDMEKISTTQLRDWLGKDIAEAMSVGDLMVDLEKMAEVVPTLDRGAAAMFDRMLEEAKITPVVKEKIAADAPLAGSKLVERAAARMRRVSS